MEAIPDGGKSDETGNQTAEQRTEGRARVNGNAKLSAHSKTIFSDWPNWAEHMEWVATASVREIVDWAETVEKA